MSIINVGIVGNGFVGKATSLFASDFVKIRVYDIDPKKCVPKETTLNDIRDCDLVFVCVPTPMKTNGQCHLGIVESVVLDLQKGNCQVPICLRSTVPPGTCERLNVHHMPEFLTERRWEYDFRQSDKWVIGENKNLENCKRFRETITNIIGHASRDGIVKGHEIWWGTTKETELTKYTRNAFLATKVAFFNEIYQLSEALGTRYDWVREMTTIDPRIGTGHSRVPGFDGKCGFSGTCLPKDLNALINVIKDKEMTPYVTQAVWNRNVEVDRCDRDWEENEGRSVISEK